MKIVLVNPPVREWAKPNCFPLGLGYIASTLRAEGYDVEAWDINAYRWDRAEVEEKIKLASFDVLGISGIITTYKYIKWFVDKVKKYHPGKKVIVGGSAGSSIPHIVLERNPVDVVCIGEGEETVKDLMKTIKSKINLSSVKGIWYKDKTGSIRKNEHRPPIKNLDDIPLPAWDLFPMEIYLKNPVGAPNRNKWTDGASGQQTPLSMNLFAARGCPYKCIYCYHDFMGQGYRHRSPRNILKEIEILYSKYNVTYFHFIDDEFVFRKDFVFEFCELIKVFNKNIKNKITWGCTGRANLMSEDIIAAMAGAGCVLIGYGIESGSQKMLDLIKKRVTVKQAKNAVRLTKKYLGRADCSFMIGYPGESKETIQETINFCKELDLAPEVIFFLTAYPGTELYTMALEQGKITDEEEYILGLGEQGENIKVNFTQFSDKELFRTQEDMIRVLGAWNKLKHIEGR